MRLRATAILAVLILGATLGLGAFRSTADGVELDLAIPGEAPLFASDEPVLIGGLWHDLRLTLDTPAQNSLILEAVGPDYERGSLASHYRWEYDALAELWTDPLYGFFVDPPASVYEGSAVTFRLGMDATASTGSWTVSVSQDGVVVQSFPIQVQAPRMGYGLSSADFNFRAEPYQEVALTSEAASQYLRVINNGNVPLRLNVSFDQMGQRLSLVNPSDIAHILQDRRYFLQLELDPRPPQIIPIQGVARVEPTYVIPSPGSSQIVPSFESTFNLQVVVGRSGYVVHALGNVFFQALESLRAAYDSIIAWPVYLTGDQPVTIDVSVVDAEFLSVHLGESQLSLPATLTLTPTGEVPLTVSVRTTVPDTLAQIRFTLRVPNSGEVQTYVTIIDVGPAPAPPPLEPSLLWLIASFISASVVAFVSYNHWKLITLSPATRRLEWRTSRAKGRGGRTRERAGKRKRRASDWQDKTAKVHDSGDAHDK